MFLERKAHTLRCVGKSAGVVLDVACGPGIMTHELARVASVYLGIDSASGMIKEAHASARALSNVRLCVADANQIPLPSESADTLCAIGLLEYLPDPCVTLREWHRILRPQGRLIVSVPYAYSPWNVWDHQVYLPLRRITARLIPLPAIRALKRHTYSVSSYIRMANAAGFSTEQVEFFNVRLLPRSIDYFIRHFSVPSATLGSWLRTTPLRIFGTGFLAVSSRT